MRLGRIGRLQRREMTLLWLCLATVVIALVSKYAIGPYAARWSAAGEGIARRERMLAKSARVLGAQGGEKGAEAMLARIQPSGSREEEIAAFLREVESLSRDAVRITGMKPLRAEDGKDFSLISIEIDVEGDMAPLGRFIYEIYRSPMLLDVEQLDLGPSGADPGMVQGHLVVSRIIFRS